MQTFTKRSRRVFGTDFGGSSASLPPRLAVDTFRDRVLQEQSSGPASTANYHQSRGLIKVWLSSECSWGYAERGDREGSHPRSHGVCQRQALWNWIVGRYQPLTLSTTALGEFSSWEKENSLKGEENCAAACPLWARKVRRTVTREAFTNEVLEGLNV